MPTRPRPPCNHPGWPPCPERAGTTRPGQYQCDPHDQTTRAASDRARRPHHRYGRAHRETFAAGVLARDNVCRCDECDDHGPICTRAPDTADHWPRTKRQLEDLGLDPTDPQYGRALCKTCHDRHTSRSSGRHGYRPST